MDILIHIVCFLILGPFIAELVGYFWHRFIEHKGYFGEEFSYRHYCHHEIEYPIHKLRTKEYKDANSWTWYVLAAGASVGIFFILPTSYAVATMIGSWIYAYACLLFFHTAFHIKGHFLWKYKWFRKLVRLHDIHHYDNCNYGICMFFFDRLFGTYRDTFPDKKQKVFKYFD